MSEKLVNTKSEQQSKKPDLPRTAITAVTSEELLGPGNRLQISHNDDYYTLRITANNKLLLTK